MRYRQKSTLGRHAHDDAGRMKIIAMSRRTITPISRCLPRQLLSADRDDDDRRFDALPARVVGESRIHLADMLTMRPPGGT